MVYPPNRLPEIAIAPSSHGFPLCATNQSKSRSVQPGSGKGIMDESTTATAKSPSTPDAKASAAGAMDAPVASGALVPRREYHIVLERSGNPRKVTPIIAAPKTSFSSSPDVELPEVIKKPVEVPDPEDQNDDNHTVQDRFDLPLHRNEPIHKPQQKPDCNDCNDDGGKWHICSPISISRSIQVQGWTLSYEQFASNCHPASDVGSPDNCRCVGSICNCRHEKDGFGVSSTC